MNELILQQTTDILVYVRHKKYILRTGNPMQVYSVLKKLLALGKENFENEIGSNTYDCFYDLCVKRFNELLSLAPSLKNKVNQMNFSIAVPLASIYITLVNDFKVGKEKAATVLYNAAVIKYRKDFVNFYSKVLSTLMYKTSIGRKFTSKSMSKLTDENGWKYRQHKNSPLEFSFSVEQCPISNYFKEIGIQEITWVACKLDYILEETINVRLIRSHTIAEGFDSCGFLYKIGNSTQK